MLKRRWDGSRKGFKMGNLCCKFDQIGPKMVQIPPTFCPDSSTDLISWPTFVQTANMSYHQDV